MQKFTYDTVYIVDDNNTANLVHEHLLKRICVAPQIKSFTNPLRALKKLNLELLADEKQILVLLDIHMPEMNGFEFLNAFSLFSVNNELVDVVMVSSSIDEKEIQQGLEYPIVRKIITKPLKETQLLDFIKQKGIISA
ncbi:response regulator [Maribacter algarum]|uniref:Response regulator n=1 Tax=Maribacter algarum (ex Zhang et al. 2020) TaxID=2578118 RepID=A0A5S3PPN0_9FLAO|nr:response regulator [Maribacter algarum]TMM56644.1 response regulator [Maribacter algarum]